MAGQRELGVVGAASRHPTRLAHRLLFVKSSPRGARIRHQPTISGLLRAAALLLPMILPGALGRAEQPFLLPHTDAAWNADHVPFSFRYGGEDSRHFLKHWTFASSPPAPNSTGGVLRQSYVFADPKTHLSITAEETRFPAFPQAVDWVLRIRNDGQKDSGILEDILPLDIRLKRTGAGWVLHHARGSNAEARDFAEWDEAIDPKGKLHLQSADGDSSSGESLPFFNLDAGSYGMVAAIGWTGNWKADFDSNKKRLDVRAGMQRTHLLLHPGEEMRTPRILLLSWSGGSWQDAQNRWRRLLLAHYTPQEAGSPMRGPILFGSWGSEPASQKLAVVEWLRDTRLPVTLYGIDAGWYGRSSGAEDNNPDAWWHYRGDWTPSARYYPGGLQPIGDALAQAGLGFSLWVEPETAMPNTAILREHPDWFLQSDHANPPGAALLNLGNDAALAGAWKLLDGLIADAKLTWYRQDFNLRPARYWEMADAPDRIGITEIRDIEGLYAFWDHLLAKYPGLHIDNCASGGRRLDLEMMARSFVVWRTDYGFSDPVAEEAQTQALAPWVPETMGFESETRDAPWQAPGPYDTAASLYKLRSGYAAGFGVNPGSPRVEEGSLWLHFIREVLAEYRSVQPYLYGDYFGLVSPGLDPTSWSVAQWSRPESGDGVVLAFRRPGSSDLFMDLSLQEIDPAASYDIHIDNALNEGLTAQVRGSALQHFRVKIAGKPGSALIFYKRR